MAARGTIPRFNKRLYDDVRDGARDATNVERLIITTKSNSNSGA